MHNQIETANPQIEVWGGAEYTYNRVGEKYFDQLALSGHAQRPHDLELFAELGIRALRCGVLWEHHDLTPSWQTSDAYLSGVRDHGMRPIAGLVHHGSGPKHTSLVDPDFPVKLARYAGQVAARYPWIDAYTPINEPNTTARFSCLYGIWYPHHRSQTSYLRALLTQVKAVVLSMRAIRVVRSDAQLVQTDDLGRVWSTQELASTSQLMNERRWLAYDLLCGRVSRFHPLYEYLHSNGISDHEIAWFRDNPCPPNTIGVNYYVTSDRFLDHRSHAYAASCRSAEGPFVDLEAVRIRPRGIQGFAAILLEAHKRYGLPVAITEVHLGDTADEQIRWAAAAWKGAIDAQRAGVTCQAVTFWALLGSYFWNNLVTSDNGHYEAGVFDLRSGRPASTVLTDLVRQCSEGKILNHPALFKEGWWQRSDRLHSEWEAELVS